MAKLDINTEKNRDANLLLISRLEQRIEEAKAGGGAKSAEKQHKKGKMTARERIAALIDPESDFMEIGTMTGYEMYAAEGGCPSGGVVTGIGVVTGHQCMIIANDATVKAGAWFPITAKKNLRAQEIAMENRLPLIYLVDSAGVYLPMQDEIFPDKEHFGRIFRNNAKISAMGIPQLAAIMGSCVAGGAYLPIMSDETVIVKGTGSVFLAGPYLVQAAIGEVVDEETLGGAETQTLISGVTDYIAEDDEDCINILRELTDKWNIDLTLSVQRVKPKPPTQDLEHILSILPEKRNQPYDSLELIESLVDEGKFTEYKKGFGQTILCGYAHIDGWPVGIVANNRLVVKNAQGEMQFGGVIYSDSADKAARFILNCNQKRIPLIFLQDVTGFMVGTRSEHGGIIKDGAKMVNAMSNTTVPKITVIIGNSYGAGNYAMCGKAFDPRFILAWPSARIAVMGGEQASKVLVQLKKSSVKKSGEEWTPELEKEITEQTTSDYEKELSPYYAAARLWVDEIIDPRKTRHYLSTCLSITAREEIPPFTVGVIQT